jgi:hypothetical protein
VVVPSPAAPALPPLHENVQRQVLDGSIALAGSSKGEEGSSPADTTARAVRRRRQAFTAGLDADTAISAPAGHGLTCRIVVGCLCLKL